VLNWVGVRSVWPLINAILGCAGEVVVSITLNWERRVRILITADSTSGSFDL
jgi:hypothetical protein